MRIIHYTQHVLGMGHLFRSLEIDRALEKHEVHLVTGGPRVPVPIPSHVVHHEQRPLQMDARFSTLFSPETGSSLDAIFAHRGRMLEDLMQRVRPDIFLMELFPFGRKKFGRELLPILQGIRKGRYGPVHTVCSLRDILVEKPDQARYEQRVVERINTFVDRILVHADPSLIRLETTFSRVADLIAPLQYTGYVTPRPEPGAGKHLRADLGISPEERLIVVSAGSGAVGFSLLHAVVLASVLLARTRPHALHLFSGPQLQAPAYDALAAAARGSGHIHLSRFTGAFPHYLDAADLSISMAGYNTVMNLLAARTFGLVLPFAQNREQNLRAARLEARGTLSRLFPEDLTPETLAEKMAWGLGHGVPDHGLDLEGAVHTARILESPIPSYPAGTAK